MFNFDDINNPRDLGNKIPEGMTDETEFAIIMQSILKHTQKRRIRRKCW
jgi:hypothetical protein